MDVHPLPTHLTPHEVTIKPLTGEGSHGPVFGQAVTVPAFVVDERVLVRDDSGAEVVSSTAVHLDFDVAAPPGSLVTVWPGVAGEREAVVISTERSAHPRLAAYQTLRLK